ncbi:MAG: hypothetical protein PHC28_11080 [Flavobacterium sp.]|uniref:hypothetical protein n=1 Tax=Flavobacterium sp. TaxID=239 RepID=UPI00260E7AB6|nr:hypothetical protein [Flavobacterium sp.]MDD5150998.1 hypothetical protein [Flavobacterium sp.]
MKKTTLTFLTILFVAGIVNAQTGIGTTTPDASAILDVSSSTKGFLFPRMTTLERDAIENPATGLTVFNSTTNALEINKGTTIAPLWTASTGAPGTAGLLTAGNAAGNTPFWNGTNWIINSSSLFNNGGNIGIGTTTPTANLEVVGTTKTTDLQVTNGAVAGKILTSDAIGNATWQDATGLKYLGKLQTDVGSSGTPMINNNTMTTLTWLTPYIDYASSLSLDGQTITIPAGVSKVRITTRVSFLMFYLTPLNVFHSAKAIITLNGSNYGWASTRVSTNQDFLLFNGWNFSSPLLDVTPGDAIQVKVLQNNGLDYGLSWGSENNTFLVVEYYQ